MAYTYGTVNNCKVRNGQTRKEYQVRLGYEVQSQSIADNTSSVKLKLECRSINSSYATYNSTKGLTSIIDGTTVKDNKPVDMRSTNTWQNFGERTITVKHSDNGTYSASKSGSFTCTAGTSDYSLTSGSASVTVAPATIPRYATVSHSLSGRTSSSLTISWSSDNTIDYIWYSRDNGSTWTGIDITDGTSGSYTITGLASNTGYNIKTRVRRKDSQLTTDSATLTAYTHPITVASISFSSKTSSSITVTSGCNVDVSSTHYRIAKSGGSYGNWQTSGTFTGLAANTTYTIQVQKVGSASGEAGYASTSATTYAITTPTISLSSKTINTITVTSGCNVTVSSTHYRIAKSGGSYGNWQTSGSFTGLAANTTYTIQVQKVGSASGEAGYATISVTTYQIATISTGQNINLGDNEAVTFANPSGSTMALGIYKTDGSTELASYRAVTGTSYTFTFTDTELDAIYKAMGTNNSVTIRLYLRTTCNNSSYYHTKDIVITLTGNKKTGHIKVSSSWKRTQKWIKIGGTWRRCVRWIKVNGTWRRCI